MTSTGASARRLRLARHVVDSVGRRAAFHEGLGAQWACSGRTEQRGRGDVPVGDEAEGEAARMAAIVEARAEGHTDPDWYD